MCGIDDGEPIERLKKKKSTKKGLVELTYIIYYLIFYIKIFFLDIPKDFFNDE